MKFGICIPSHRDIMPLQAVLEVPQRAEEAGYDSVWVNDHVVVPNDALGLGFTPTYYDACTVLTYAAARTSRVGLGISVLVLPIRHPLIHAKVLATLDAISGGRVICGVGVGSLQNEYAALGVPHEERGPRADETLAIFNEVWSAEDPKFDGRFFSFSDIKFGPKPAQQPRIPIWVGGSGRASIRRAAQFGDAWHPQLGGVANLAESRARLEEQRKRFGRDGAAIITGRLNARILPEARAGDGERAKGDGSADQVAADLEEWRAEGIDYIVLDFARSGRTTPEQWNYCFETFAKEVLPRFG
jgi:probable F420-dependent oxidoreductase